WPRSTLASPFESQRRTVRSALAETSVPVGVYASATTVPVCPAQSRYAPLRRSQMRTSPSTAPVASIDPSSENAEHRTTCPGPERRDVDVPNRSGCALERAPRSLGWPDAQRAIVAGGEERPVGQEEPAMYGGGVTFEHARKTTRLRVGRDEAHLGPARKLRRE